MPYVKGILFNLSNGRNGIWLKDLSHEITSHILCIHVINNFNIEYKFTAWVAKITKNKFIDYLKKQNKYANEYCEARLLGNNYENEIINEIINHSDYNFADAYYLQNEKNNYLNNIIEKYLNNDMKTVIKLWYYEGLNQEEIAELTGWSTNQVGVLHHRAKQKIKKYINY